MSVPEPRCERCELPVGQCEHTRARPAADSRRVLVSPQFMAHLDGCMHKDDPDFSRWGEIVGVPRAWERIGAGEVILTNGGARHGLPADLRCSYCASR